MHWNYRIISDDNKGYGLYEVFYEDDGTPIGASAKPTDFYSESVAGVVESLKQALSDVNRSIVLTWDDIRGEE